MANKLSQESITDDYVMSLASIYPIRSAVMFTIMRMARMAVTFVCEVITLVSAIVFGVFGFFSGCWLGSWALIIALVPLWITVMVAAYFNPEFALQPEYYTLAYLAKEHPYNAELAKPLGWQPAYPVVWFFMNYPLLAAVPAFWLMTVAIGQALAAGVPYRWTNLPPGVGVVICAACKKEVRGGIRCPACGESRVRAYAAIKVIYMVNVVITGIWITHDTIFAAFGLAGSFRGK